MTYGLYYQVQKKEKNYWYWLYIIKVYSMPIIEKKHMDRKRKSPLWYKKIVKSIIVLEFLTLVEKLQMSSLVLDNHYL